MWLKTKANLPASRLNKLDLNASKASNTEAYGQSAAPNETSLADAFCHFVSRHKFTLYKAFFAAQPTCIARQPELP